MTTTTAESRMQYVGSGEEAVAEKGAGWVLFAGIMLMLIAVLNVIYGIAAIGNSHFFAQNTHYVFGSLNTWGWVTLAVGAIQGFAALSIWAGGRFGQWVGIAIACVGAVAALLAIPAYPFWSLAIFAIDVLVVYGLVAYGGNRRITA